MSELDTILLTKIEKIDSDVSDVKVDIAKIQVDVEHHIKRTDGLQDITTELHTIVQPLYQEYMAKKAVDDYKKRTREDLIYKLKLPGYIVAALAAMGTALAWIMSK